MTKGPEYGQHSNVPYFRAFLFHITKRADWRMGPKGQPKFKTSSGKESGEWKMTDRM
jgi:hypothetical protein